MAADTYNKLMEMAEDELYKWFNELSSREFRNILMKIRKDQDRDTRHACAEAVLDITPGVILTKGICGIFPDDAHDACINAKAL